MSFELTATKVIAIKRLKFWIFASFDPVPAVKLSLDL
jgi:hypothetical protein